ncbi:MAG: response regulator [Eisenbergiella massiliensis]
MDIVIMDINMPQMSGLELYDIVRKMAFCKVIFLTGYSDLTMYIRSISMQNMC